MNIHSRWGRIFTIVVILSLLLGWAPLISQPVQAESSGLVISQVYGGGGNSGATIKYDFVEIFNRGTTAVSLNGMSLQYASATGSGAFGSSSTQITELPNVTLLPGQYYLVREALGSGGTDDLSGADLIDATPINMSGTTGKVALVNSPTGLGCNGGSLLCSPEQTALIIDLLGWGSANYFEGAVGPATTNTTAAFRKSDGCQDTDNNAADFVTGAPNPRNTSSPVHSCDVISDTAPVVSSVTPANNTIGVAQSANLKVTFSEAVTLGASWISLSCSISGDHPVAVNGGPSEFTINPDTNFVRDDVCTAEIDGSQVSDQDAIDPPDAMASNFSWTFNVVVTPITIREVQGAGHLSPYNNNQVALYGIVTAIRNTGYYVQDPNPDLDDATSEGIFVFTSSRPNYVTVGDNVLVDGRVSEYRPGGGDNLTLTELTNSWTTVLTHGNAIPAPIVLGVGGRIPPSQIIENDATNVETGGTFDPAEDGIDFYESLEGMLVQVNDAALVSPLNGYGEMWVVADSGANSSVRTGRGGVVIQADDYNPERIQLDDEVAGLDGWPSDGIVGDTISGPVVGVLDYAFSNYEVLPLQAPTVVSNGLEREVTGAADGQLAVAAFNLENLDANDSQEKFDTLAQLIVTNLQSPDILALEEIQDNNGATNNGIVAADLTLERLIEAILFYGGPEYDFRLIDPVNNQDGGEPGGNIRVGFLFRSDQGVSFVDRPGGTATLGTGVQLGDNGVELTYSPGRIDPTNAAFESSRKPLAGEFTYQGRTFIVIANHFNSKGGDLPLFGRIQPPTLSSEVQRMQQAQVVAGFVSDILTLDPMAKVIVAGDLNDFHFSAPLQVLKDAGLTPLIETLPLSEQYTYVYDGNSQALDHILFSPALFDTRLFDYDVVHVNAEFSDQASDHDPQVVRITFNDPPTVSAGGPYSMAEDGEVLLSATGSDYEGGELTYVWDLDNDGVYETPGQEVIFSALGLDGPGSYPVGVQVTDPIGLTGDAYVYVEVTNSAPVVDIPALSVSPSKLFEPVTASATFADPYQQDGPFTCTVDYGDGLGAVDGVVTGNSCQGPEHIYTAVGAYTVTVAVTDKDLGTGSRSVSHSVLFDFTGFYAPVENSPMFNLMKAGNSVPIKFSLAGDQGMGIVAAGYPRSTRVACNTDLVADDVEETLTSGSSGLQYNAFEDMYVYVWKTNKSWVGTCRQFTLMLTDGSQHTAFFSFR